MTKGTLTKFLNNTCSETELQEVILWAKECGLTEESKNWGFENWQTFSELSSPDDDKKFSVLFDKIQHRIDLQSDENHGNTKLSSRYSIAMMWMTKAAAILLIPVLSVLFYTLSERKAEKAQYATLVSDSIEVIAPIGSRTVVQLSDGTEVYLNYGSKIKYPQFFIGATREVILSGEGFFKVAHDPAKPFIVKTGKLNVKALGTIFNVFAYPYEEIIETTLIEGKVLLEKKVKGDTYQAVASMEPGQHVNFNIQSESLQSSQGNTDRYIAWKDGRQVFEDAPLSRVAERLSRIFNVDIQVDEQVKDYNYTVTFVDEPLFQILDMMTMATPVTYQALPRKKLPDGTFSKQKIVIQKRG